MGEWETAVMEHGCGLQQGGLGSIWKTHRWIGRREEIPSATSKHWNRTWIIKAKEPKGKMG